eukprot:CAMPEP_0174726604 /NCGR_PEP_ID=MMETSP1094-20130205/48140_1 /TAXON_ID=156173 /ORGANISM="Chrysochromulina brevifilum, Strain UTEX LB 985" /LENGTH=177 /DNA_ID=CAMNT_0015928211 /DNA_START=18 /DNA_END=548 /DNA_ORIENTATION=+
MPRPLAEADAAAERTCEEDSAATLDEQETLEAPAGAHLEIDEPHRHARRRCIPQRYVVALMACTVAAISYGQRYGLAIAIVKMQASLEWSRHTQGQVLASFFLGYMVAQLPGGWFAARYGAGAALFASLLISSCVNLLLPPAAVVSSWLVCALRLLQGLAQGVLFPGIAALWTDWAP